MTFLVLLHITSEFVSILSFSVTTFVVCFVFSCHCVTLFIFPLCAQFPKILHALPHQSDVYPASMLEGPVNRVLFEQMKEREALVRCHALPPGPAKPVCF